MDPIRSSARFRLRTDSLLHIYFRCTDSDNVMTSTFADDTTVLSSDAKPVTLRQKITNASG